MEYIRKFRDMFGRIQYECECHICKSKCYYARQLNNGKEPTCFKCSKEKVKQYAKDKRQKDKKTEYCKGIDDFLKKIEELCGCEASVCVHDYNIDCVECSNFIIEYSTIKDVAEKLKGENE